MVNPFIEVNWNPERGERRKFALTLMGGLPVASGLWMTISRYVTGEWKQVWMWIGAIGFAVGLVLWLLPALARPFYVLWHLIGCTISFIGGNVVLSLFFYLVMTPFGWVMRKTGRLSVSKGFDRSKATYWEKSEKVVDSRDYYRQF
jgi:hypothetical protein